MRPALLAAGLAIAIAQSAAAQPAKTPTRNDPFPGYKKQTVEGFTVIVSEDVLGPTGDKYERKPLDVLASELKAVNRVLPPRLGKALRAGLLVWVEWDDPLTNLNDRAGTYSVVYAGGHQAQAIVDDKNPLKARNLVVLSMKAITEEHQPKVDSGRCMLLHEVAHALQDRILREEGPRIRAAYNQALERKLYDKTTFAVASEQEFFAEMTCCYLDRLGYYPQTAEDLKKADPVTYKTFEAIFGKPPTPAADDPRFAVRKFDMATRIEKWELGETLSGPEAKPEGLKGKVLLLYLFDHSNADALGGLQRLNAWHASLGVFGLQTVAAQAVGAGAEEVRDTTAKRGVEFSVVGSVKAPEEIVPRLLPHCLVFDHEGKCVYRGETFGAEQAVREAVGRSLLAAAGQAEWSAEVKPLADALARGDRPPTLAAKLGGLTRSKTPEVAEQSRLLVRTITEGGRRRLEEADGLSAADPITAYLIADALGDQFKDTLVGVKADELAAKLKRNKIVSSELKARAVLETIRKLETALERQSGSNDPKSQKFQNENGAALVQLGQYAAQMKRTWPTAKATQEALKAADRFGVAPPK